MYEKVLRVFAHASLLYTKKIFLSIKIFSFLTFFSPIFNCMVKLVIKSIKIYLFYTKNNIAYCLLLYKYYQKNIRYFEKRKNRRRQNSLRR